MTDDKRKRLEDELRFLEESLRADVISKSEYEEAKERLIKEIEKTGQEETKAEEPSEEEYKEEKPAEKEIIKKEDKKAKPKKEKKKPVEEAEEKKIIIKEIKREPVIEGLKEKTEEPSEKKTIEKEPIEKEGKPIEKIEEIKKEKSEEEPEEAEVIGKKKPRRIKRKLINLFVLIIVIILGYYIFFGGEKVKPACSMNSDCIMGGVEGICLNPGQKDSECKFVEETKVSLIVLNEDDCKVCDTKRMLGVIKQLFPGVEVDTLDYNSEKGKELVDILGIKALPAYIFWEDIEKAENFDEFKRALRKENDYYIITPAASGANYFFKRINKPNTLEVFTTKEFEDKAEANLKGFLEIFWDKINFDKHIVTDNKEFKEELGITTFPVFLINNRIKFGGVQSADKIKSNFCSINYIEECKSSLSAAIE